MLHSASQPDRPASEVPRRHAMTLAVLVTALVLLVVGVGCTRSTGRVRIAASPAAGLVYGPFDVTVSGLRPGVHVLIRSEAYDPHPYTAQATFAADRSGRVDVAASSPLSGSYTGTYPSGLLWSMTTKAGENAFLAPAGRFTVTLRALVDGRQVATTTVSRQFSASGVTGQTLTLAQQGVYGHMFHPAGPATKHTAILDFGGSEGGLSDSEAVALASRGYPTLVIAYFGEPGLPTNLENIPLEYFGQALRALASEPDVDPHRIVVSGGSRGSEAALLLAVHYPDLVHAVIATSPSAVVNPGIPDGSAWTWQARPVPSVSAGDLGRPAPRDDPQAIIPVERIAGPVLTLCGTGDRLWPSCPYAAAIAERRTENNVGSADVNIEEPGAGHLVGYPVPNMAVTPDARHGGTLQADAVGRLDAWPRILAFLGAQSTASTS